MIDKFIVIKQNFIGTAFQIIKFKFSIHKYFWNYNHY